MNWQDLSMRQRAAVFQYALSKNIPLPDIKHYFEEGGATKSSPDFSYRAKWYEDNPSVIKYIRRVGNLYGVNPVLIADRMAKEGPVDRDIQYNKEGVNDWGAPYTPDVPFLDKNSSGPIFGLDTVGSRIADNEIPLKDIDRGDVYTDVEMIQENGRTTYAAEGQNNYDNINLMAATLAVMRDRAKQDFPNATEDELDRMAAAYYNRGEGGARSLIKSRQKRGKGFGYDIDVNIAKVITDSIYDEATPISMPSIPTSEPVRTSEMLSGDFKLPTFGR